MMAPPQGGASPTQLALGSGGSALTGPHIVKAAVLAGKPTFIQWNKLRFLIMDSPRVSKIKPFSSRKE